MQGGGESDSLMPPVWRLTGGCREIPRIPRVLQISLCSPNPVALHNPPTNRSLSASTGNTCQEGGDFPVLTHGEGMRDPAGRPAQHGSPRFPAEAAPAPGTSAHKVSHPHGATTGPTDTTLADGTDPSSDLTSSINRAKGRAANEHPCCLRARKKWTIMRQDFMLPTVMGSSEVNRNVESIQSLSGSETHP